MTNEINHDIPDTSADYDDMVGYVATENIKSNILAVLEEEDLEYVPEVSKRKVDPEFPEDWQNLYVNFDSQENYFKFMQMIGAAPLPKLNEHVYESTPSAGIFDFV